jgi:peptidyl-prolyl cis-trans isomerase C
MTRSTPRLAALLIASLLLLSGLLGCKKNAPQGGAATAQTGTAAPASGQANPGAPATAAPGATAGRPAELATIPGHQGQPGQAANAQPMDPAKLPAVVAKINGVEIKKAELVNEALQFRQQLAQMRGIQAPLSEAVYREALNSIIARTLLQQEAQEQKVTVSDAEVEEQIAAIRRRFPDAAGFQQALAAQGLTEAALRQQMKREGAVQKLVMTKVLGNLTVSDQAAKEFYDKNQAQMKRPERVHLRHILVKAASTAQAAEKAKARARAEELLKRVQNGEDFAKVASEASEDAGTKPRGGDLSWIVRGQTDPSLEKAAFGLTKPNEMTGVVESPYGYHIIQLVEREGSGVVPFEEAKPKIAEFLRQRLSQQKLQVHVQELRAKGKVETFI